MLVCVFVCYFCTRDRGCSAHPVFPAPSLFRGGTNLQNSGECRRENADAYPPSLRGALATKQSSSSLRPWIASLRSSGLRPRLRILATAFARGLQIRSALKRRRAQCDPKRDAGKTGCALHPRSHVHWVDRKTHMSIQVQRKQSGLPCAMALQLIPCSPR